jgi:ABC-2 type transport system permease protein
MRKFLAVVKHEYKKIVFKWTFLLATLLFPFIAAMFAIVPAIIFSLKSEPTRIVVVDTSGKIAPRLKENLSPEKIAARAKKAVEESSSKLNASQEEQLKRGSEQMGAGFIFKDYDAAGKSPEQIRRELNGKITEGALDAYLIVPPDIEASDAKFEFLSRKAGDFVVNDALEDGLNEAVRSQRLADANISEERLRELSRNIKLNTRQVDEKGNEKDSDMSVIAAFAIGFMIYITLAIYGQAIMGAVVEEKETRIAEILFSSAKPFELMIGKLVGVGLAALTQLAIWIISAVVLVGFSLAQFAGTADMTLPTLTPLMVVYFFIFFLLGFFIYASIFALIGSMVTTMQEGSQFAFPPIMILLIGFYFIFAVVRDPNSSLSFWVSIAPFFAPITMPVRIFAEMPPFWQIALSILINAATIAGLVWLASRVYRIGMLMYGKRATIPEVWKWIRLK